MNRPTLPQDQATHLEADAALEQLLRQDAAQWRDAYIDNDGFSDRVMARIDALPAPQTGLSIRQRLTIIGAAVLGGVLLATFAGNGADLLIDAVMDLATETVTPTVLGLVALLASAGALAVVAAQGER
ncbi:MAG: hypothetical protein ACK5UX_03930 [Burkholderiales bacterium]